MIRRSKKRLKYKEIFRQAGELGQENKGFAHRNHRVKPKKSGKNKSIGKKVDIEKIKEEEIWEEFKEKYTILNRK